MPDPQTRDADLVVIGAGLAGLSAARAAAAAGASVVVVEARDRVGGRVLNEDIGGGNVVEVGAQWIGPTQDHLAALAAKLGVETFPTYGEGENVIEYGGRLRRYRGTIPRINPVVLLDVERAQRRLNRMARRVPLDAPWEAPDAAALDGQTAATWMRRNLVTRTGRMLLELGIEAVWAAQPEDMSLLHVLFYIHSAGSLEMLFDTEGGAQQDRFMGGSQRVPILMAQELGRENVLLGSPVRMIRRGEHGVTVEADGATVRARRAVVAVAPTLAGRIAYDPPLPGDRDQLTQRMPNGSAMKAFFVYDEPFWRAEGLNGQLISDVGPARMSNDTCVPGDDHGVILLFLEGEQARAANRLTPAERQAALTDELVRHYGSRAARPHFYVDGEWSDRQWTRGCYNANMGPLVWTTYGSTLAAPIGVIHWASTDTASSWSAYMEGAVEAGERAAHEVIRAR